MAKLHYSTLMSLDGYIADQDGNFDWAAPDAEVHHFINERERPIAIYLYGRRIYEVMAVWETMHTQPNQPPEIYDYAAVWQSAQKIVYSRTLEKVWTARTSLEREFDPEKVRQMKARFAEDMGVANADLGGQAIRHGLVDEISLYIAPVIVGGGTKALPDGARLDLTLEEERRFAGGMVYLRYTVANRSQ